MVSACRYVMLYFDGGVSISRLLFKRIVQSAELRFFEPTAKKLFFPQQLHWRKFKFEKFFLKIFCVMIHAIMLLVSWREWVYHYKVIITQSSFSFKKLRLSSLPWGGGDLLTGYWKRPDCFRNIIDRASEIRLSNISARWLEGWSGCEIRSQLLKVNVKKAESLKLAKEKTTNF